MRAASEENRARHHTRKRSRRRTGEDLPIDSTADSPLADDPSHRADRTTPAALAVPAWQAAVRDAVRDPAELAALLELTPEALGALAEPTFPLLVPRGFVARMRRGDPADPLLRQVVPLPAEQRPALGFGADPVGEQNGAAHGVIRKYAGRALLIASGACPVHCRYCFRREFPYDTQLATRGGFVPALEALRGQPDLEEVILSGGDPLSLSNRKLGELLAKLADTPAKTVRIHTRFPVVIPERIDAELLRLLDATPLRKVVVTHSNHANELDGSVAAALARLRPHVDALLNQSVLLRGVNDDAATLAALSNRLLECGVLPYYLHALDRVAGAAHFDVNARRARELVAELRARLPGYLVPRLVRELPGELSKTPLA